MSSTNNRFNFIELTILQNFKFSIIINFIILKNSNLKK